MKYLPRVADAAMTDLLSALGGVLVEGPRGCGKTTTALQHAGSHVRNWLTGRLNVSQHAGRP